MNSSVKRCFLYIILSASSLYSMEYEGPIAPRSSQVEEENKIVLNPRNDRSKLFLQKSLSKTDDNVIEAMRKIRELSLQEPKKEEKKIKQIDFPFAEKQYDKKEIEERKKQILLEREKTRLAYRKNKDRFIEKLFKAIEANDYKKFRQIYDHYFLYVININAQNHDGDSLLIKAVKNLDKNYDKSAVNIFKKIICDDFHQPNLLLDFDIKNKEGKTAQDYIRPKRAILTAWFFHAKKTQLAYLIVKHKDN